MINLICKVCGKSFSRKTGEVNRNKKLNRKIYCSLECVGKDNNNHLQQYDNSANLIANNKLDEYSQFRRHLSTVKTHAKQKNKTKNYCNITLQDLKNQWIKQNGICPYTGWSLKMRATSCESLPKTPDRASLDRIDSSKPYTKDNIQFISMMAQFAKNSWPQEELIKFCKAVVEHNERNQR